jgi:hypothetical protein
VREESPRSDDPGEQSLDERLDAEREEIAELEEANQETEEGEDGSEVEEGDEDPSGDKTASGDYKPNAKYKVLDEEHEFDPKLKSLLTKETEPIIRELYEKAHGIEAIKTSRAQATRERDEVRGNYQNLVGEVGRILNYKKGGDLQSFFESVQLDDNTIAKYIMEKARIAALPPDQQAVYNEYEANRRRLNAVEQQLQNTRVSADNSAVQARVTELDQVLSSSETSPVAKAFDARNGKGAFKQAVMEHGAAKFYATKKDLSAPEAVQSFIKMNGLSAPKGQPKPGADATKRVVARPKVKTIPNYGGGQASVTSTKPKSIADLRKLSREMSSR